MKSKVYFIRLDNHDSQEVILKKLSQLLAESRILDFIKAKSSVALKLHFGEEENTGFVKPEFVRVICDQVKAKQAKPILSDTNTLYRGRRTSAAEHLKLAIEHGFTPRSAGAEVMIPDDFQKESIAQVSLNGNFIKTAKVAKIFLDADALVGIAHFKGHIMTGFGGALKNIGMGCASREGKLAQHSDICPIVNFENCTGCGACESACPTGAITLIDKKSRIDAQKCIGCASCIAVCDYYALDVNWEAGGNVIQEKMIEHAKAVLVKQRNKTAFFNFANKITKECDCLAKDDPRIAPDVGIFASTDPVALDQATLDKVLAACGRDIFREVHPQRDGTRQLKYAAALGLGNLQYELKEIVV